MDKMKVYNRLPIPLQNLACDFEGKRIKKTRYSQIFWDKLAEYESHNTWSYEQNCEYRDKQLRKMMLHCYKNVPYYKTVFDEGGIDPQSIQTINDLQRLPVLTKDDVKANIDSLIATNVNSQNIKLHPTGGTTGAGLIFRTSNYEEAVQWAIWWRYRRWHGISTDIWCGNFGGKVTVPLEQAKPPFWRINHYGKQYFFSGYHINKNNAKYFAQCLKDKAIAWIHGYPSNIANLASNLNEQGIVVPLKWVSIGAENLYEYQIKQIEKAFCVRPLQHYGLTEGVANISEDRNGELTIDEDFSCVEFLSYENGNANEQRIIGTSLTNYIMPLIRYETGDLAIVNHPERFNSHGRVIDGLNGRSNEFVMLPNGAKVGAAAISLIINRFNFIEASQIVQNSIDSITVRVICKGKMNQELENEVLTAMHERLSKEINIKIEYVTAFEKTKSGKQRLVISNL